MQKLKYRIIPRGAANGVVPFNLIFIDKKDVDDVGISYREACELMGKELKDDFASVNIIDRDAVTVTSDGIMADSAVVAFASVDRNIINKDFGFISVSEIPYSYKLLEEEPHMKQWNTDYYRGKRLYRGPSAEDRSPRDAHNENMTMSGRIANNNTGSEMMDLVEMTEILVPFLGQIEIMRDGNVLVGLAGPEISVGIGMVVRERQGRIFGWQYGAGMTAHRSGVYAKTVKSDYPAIVADKKVVAEYTIRALEAGMIPGLHIGCSPVVLSIAKAMGYPIAFDNITDRAWIELESVGISRKSLETPSKPLSRAEVIARADEILPGMTGGKKYKVSEICQIRYAEV
jgi:hypothetical protein